MIEIFSSEERINPMHSDGLPSEFPKKDVTRYQIRLQQIEESGDRNRELLKYVNSMTPAMRQNFLGSVGGFKYPHLYRNRVFTLDDQDFVALLDFLYEDKA